MFYETEVKSHIRVAPDLFKEDINIAITKSLEREYEGYISKDLGIVVGVLDVLQVGEGIIIPGDGAAYYETRYKLLVFKPELQEVVLGKITDITDFGAFMAIGPIDGMIHVSQTMDDFVSFNKSGTLSGKESKKVLKVNDPCRARIIAISYKDAANPKIGLTMRQVALGNLNWIEHDVKKKTKEEEPEKEAKTEKKGAKK